LDLAVHPDVVFDVRLPRAVDQHDEGYRVAALERPEHGPSDVVADLEWLELAGLRRLGFGLGLGELRRAGRSLGPGQDDAGEHQRSGERGHVEGALLLAAPTRGVEDERRVRVAPGK